MQKKKRAVVETKVVDTESGDLFAAAMSLNVFLTVLSIFTLHNLAPLLGKKATPPLMRVFPMC